MPINCTKLPELDFSNELQLTDVRDNTFIVSLHIESAIITLSTALLYLESTRSGYGMNIFFLPMCSVIGRWCHFPFVTLHRASVTATIFCSIR